jgi:hypothetical protein
MKPELLTDGTACAYPEACWHDNRPGEIRISRKSEYHDWSVTARIKTSKRRVRLFRCADKNEAIKILESRGYDIRDIV